MRTLSLRDRQMICLKETRKGKRQRRYNVPLASYDKKLNSILHHQQLYIPSYLPLYSWVMVKRMKTSSTSMGGELRSFWSESEYPFNLTPTQTWLTGITRTCCEI